MPFGVKAYDGGKPYRQKMDQSTRTDGQPVYIGWADAKASTASPVWRIYKITYDSSGNATDIDFARGSVNFDQIWDDRATLLYPS